MTKIVPLSASEWALAYSVHLEAFSQTAADFLSRESFQKLTVEKNALLLGVKAARGENKLLGYILCRHVEDEAEILSLGVLPGARDQGLGKGLILGALRVLKEKNVEKAFLEVRASNTAAIRAYQAGGFEKCGVRKAYYRNKTGEIEDALTMIFEFVN